MNQRDDTSPSAPDIAALEAALLQNHHSVELRRKLVSAYDVDPVRCSDPRRFEHIRWFIANCPADSWCITPHMQFRPEDAPDAYSDIKARWLALLDDGAAGAAVWRAAALFVAAGDRNEASALLERAAARFPTDARIRVDAGRIAPDPADRLRHFERARSLGDQRSNLGAWVALDAFRAGDYAKAATEAHELLRAAALARDALGDAVHWPERGRALWTRALAASADPAAARLLIAALADQVYRTHWGHTVLGLVRDHGGDVDTAVDHLHVSAELRPDFRLSADGPSIDLLRAVCARGRWDAAAAFLRAWAALAAFDELDAWTRQIEARQMPVRE